jgi:hypothetical protein
MNLVVFFAIYTYIYCQIHALAAKAMFNYGDSLSFKSFISIVITTLLLSLAIVGDVQAAGISVSCEVRGLERSKVKVKGRGLPRGKYFAKILSGGVWVKSGKKAATGRQVEFEFDSHDDEGPSVTLISPRFIQNLTVLGLIRDAKTNRLIGKFSSSCEFRED